MSKFLSHYQIGTQNIYQIALSILSSFKMPSSFLDREVTDLFDSLQPKFNPKLIEVKVFGSNKSVKVQKPYPSPIDWRDFPIYFLMIDRFNNPVSDPKSEWNKDADQSQGGTFEGVRQKLSYIKDLGAVKFGVTSIGLAPVICISGIIQFKE